MPFAKDDSTTPAAAGPALTSTTPTAPSPVIVRPIVATPGKQSSETTPAAAKREVSMASHDSDDGSPSGGDNATTKSASSARAKRKKASRACLHCQKAHLTCDDARPCGRCVKRGLAGTCHDGVRKKAKYLQDVELDELYYANGGPGGGIGLVAGGDAARPLIQTTTHATQTTGPTSIPMMPYGGYNGGGGLVATGAVPRLTPGLSTQSSDPAIFQAPPQTISMAAVSMDGGQSNGDNIFDDTFLFDYPPLSSYDFDSKAANLEYSMISTMLGRAMTPTAELTESYSMSPQALRPSAAPHFPSGGAVAGGGSMQAPAKAWSSPNSGAVSGASPGNTPAPVGQQHRPHQSSQLANAPQQASSSSSASASASNPTQQSGGLPHDSIKYDMPSPATSNQSYSSHHSRSQPAPPSTYLDPHGQRPTPVARRAVPGAGKDPSSIYKAITRPFSYTNGYHLLNAYLRNRFDKTDLVRIARAIVGYRPSFIALTKTLREEDLTFMEVCFQRTLLEYEKFVGYSGTPTVVWRRTGQIELVGKEFCLLTGWSREALLGKQTFIVELMDDASVVEYFEQFSQHAFGDTSSVVTSATLRLGHGSSKAVGGGGGDEKKQKKRDDDGDDQGTVNCAFCFTIKRDVFDIPMMIVGNFLPCLS